MNIQDKLTPLSNRVIVKPDPRKKAIGSIHIADSVQQKPSTGTVLAVGKGFSAEFPMELKAGDRIFYEVSQGIDVIINGEDCLILRDINVISIINDKDYSIEFK